MGGLLNTTYFVHDITFAQGKASSTAGKKASRSSALGSTNPLRDAAGPVVEEPGVAHTALAVTLIPTRVQRFGRRTLHAYQASAGSTVIGAENLVRSGAQIAPGLSITYDFSPLAVHQ